ncbi:MAG: ABC transporter permease, partial [Planctomycetales bacterium]|nr:ABC transporter permease [Planctomycetales bacterium]
MTKMICQSLRIEPRHKITRSLNILLPFIAIVSALLVGAIILTLSGRNAYEGYINLFSEAFLRPGALTATILTATPLIYTGLTAALAFRVRIWNIGADGQLMIGALSASGVAFFLHGASGWITVPAMIVAGALGGMIWAWVPAYFRAKFSTNEVLTTLMFNYLAPLLLGYLIFSSQSYWRDLEGPTAKIFPQGKEIP